MYDARERILSERERRSKKKKKRKTNSISYAMNNNETKSARLRGQKKKCIFKRVVFTRREAIARERDRHPVYRRCERITVSFSRTGPRHFVRRPLVSRFPGGDAEGNFAGKRLRVRRKRVRRVVQGRARESMRSRSSSATRISTRRT